MQSRIPLVITVLYTLCLLPACETEDLGSDLFQDDLIPSHNESSAHNAQDELDNDDSSESFEETAARPTCQTDVAIANTRFSDYDTPVYTVNAVTDFGADDSGKSNAAPAIQQALNCAESQYGGIVYLPAGNYLIQDEIVIPSSITLRGDWKRPTNNDKAVAGTVLYIDVDEGKAKGSTIKLGRDTKESGAGIRDLSIYYPKQSTSKPKAYPYTIEGISEFSTVRNVTLVNSYQGIRFVPQGDKSVAFPNVISVYGAPLYRGIEVHYTSATPRFQDIALAPEYWSEAGLDNTSTKNIIGAMRDLGGIGISSGDGDGGGNYTGIRVSGYDVGWNVFDQQSARVFDFQVIGCRIGIDMSHSKDHGWVFTSGTVEAEEIALRLRDKFINSGFNNIAFSSGGTLIDHGTGTVHFTKCTFNDWSKGYAIESTSGWLGVSGCTFKGQNQHIVLGQKVSRAIIFSNKAKNGKIDIKNLSNAASSKIVIDTSSNHSFVDLDTKDYPFTTPKQVPKPTAGSKNIFNVLDYGAAGTGKQDDTRAFENALKDAGNAANSGSGAVVFVPAGVYRIDGRLTVPRFVELRGVHDTPFNAEGRSILCSFADKNDPQKPAFINLEADSGVKGFYFYRPDQVWKNGSMKLYSYPPAIRGTDRNWAYNITLGNMYDGIDFSKGGGHDLEYISGTSLNKVVSLSADGGLSSLRNFQVKTEFWRNARRQISLPAWKASGFGDGAPDPEEGLGTEEIGTGLVIQGNGKFRFLSHFVNRSGDALYKIDGSPTANFYMCGGEGLGTGFIIKSNDSKNMDLEMVSNSYHTHGDAYTVSDTSSGDSLHLINCKNYGAAPISHIFRGSGKIVMQQEYRGRTHKTTLQLEDKTTGIVEGGFFDSGTTSHRIRALDSSKAFIGGTFTTKDSWSFNSGDNIAVGSICPNKISGI